MKLPESNAELELSDNLSDQERNALETLGVKVHKSRQYEIPQINENLLTQYLRDFNIMEDIEAYLKTCYLEDGFANDHGARRKWLEALSRTNPNLYSLIHRVNGIRGNKAGVISGLVSAIPENYTGTNPERITELCATIVSLCARTGEYTEIQSRIEHIEKTKTTLIDLLKELSEKN